MTDAEISFNDEHRWGQIFSQISPDGTSFGLSDFQRLLPSLGFQPPPGEARRYWSLYCQKNFNVQEAQAEHFVFDKDRCYDMFLYLGISAKHAEEKLKPGKPEPYFKLYWNQIRMGGREPGEIKRPVTLPDALAALGLKSASPGKAATIFLEQFERKQAVRLPRDLVELLQKTGAAEAIMNCHPNNPTLLDFQAKQWKLRHGMLEQQLSGDYSLVIMVPHQGNHEWAAVFDDGEKDARIYVRWNSTEGEKWLLTAPGIALFFWDLAQTGLTWNQDTRFKEKPIRCSDIGLALE